MKRFYRILPFAIALCLGVIIAALPCNAEPVYGTLLRKNTNDDFPTHISTYGYGGLLNIGNITNISPRQYAPGMIAAQTDTNNYVMRWWNNSAWVPVFLATNDVQGFLGAWSNSVATLTGVAGSSNSLVTAIGATNTANLIATTNLVVGLSNAVGVTYAPITNIGPYQYSFSGTNMVIPPATIAWDDGTSSTTLATTNFLYANATTYVGIGLFDLAPHFYLSPYDGATKWIAGVTVSNGVVIAVQSMATDNKAPPSPINLAKYNLVTVGANYPSNNYAQIARKVINLGDSQGTYYPYDSFIGGLTNNNGLWTNWFASLWDTNWLPATYIGVSGVQTYNLQVGSEAQIMGLLMLGNSIPTSSRNANYGGVGYTFPLNANLLSNGRYYPQAIFETPPTLVIIGYHNYDAYALNLIENSVRLCRKAGIPVILHSGYSGLNSSGTNYTEGAYPYIPGLKQIADAYGCLYLDTFYRAIEDWNQGGINVTNWYYGDSGFTHAGPTGQARQAYWFRDALNTHAQAPKPAPTLPQKPVFPLNASIQPNQPFMLAEYVPPLNYTGCSIANTSTNIGLFPAPASVVSPSYLLTRGQYGLSVPVGASCLLQHRMCAAMWILADASTNNIGAFSVSQNSTAFTTNTIDSSFAPVQWTNPGTYLRVYHPGANGVGTQWGEFSSIRSLSAGYLGSYYYNGNPEFASPSVRITALTNTLYIYGGIYLVPTYEDVSLSDLTYFNTNSPNTSTGWDLTDQIPTNRYFFRRVSDTAGDGVKLKFKGPWGCLWLLGGGNAGQIVIKFDGKVADSVINSTAGSGTYPNFWWDLYKSLDNILFPIVYCPSTYGAITPYSTGVVRDYTGSGSGWHTIEAYWGGGTNASVGTAPNAGADTHRIVVVGGTVGVN